MILSPGYHHRKNVHTGEISPKLCIHYGNKRIDYLTRYRWYIREKETFSKRVWFYCVSFLTTWCYIHTVHFILDLKEIFTQVTGTLMVFLNSGHNLRPPMCTLLQNVISLLERKFDFWLLSTLLSKCKLYFRVGAPFSNGWSVVPGLLENGLFVYADAL
jgi:hypothetical protein